VGGEKGTARFDRAAKRWIEDATLTKLKALYSPKIELAGATVREVIDLPKLRQLMRKKTSQECKPRLVPASFSPGLAMMQGPACGSYICRGWSWGNSKEYCCWQARMTASECCSNQWCWGCCQFLGSIGSCDAWCAFGPYFCSCADAGFACSGP
jgi:hypothetical protein